MSGAGFERVSHLFEDTGTKYKKRPRYTVVLHDIREKMDISLNTYVIIDSIHKLSTSNPRFPYCIMSKKDLADFLCLSESTVYRSLTEAADAELVDRSPHGLRATEKWIRAVEIYSINKH